MLKSTEAKDRESGMKGTRRRKRVRRRLALLLAIAVQGNRLPAPTLPLGEIYEKDDEDEADRLVRLTTKKQRSYDRERMFRILVTHGSVVRRVYRRE